MKETIKNIKRVYQYGKEYKKNLIGMCFAVVSSTVINIILPLFIAKQIVYVTSSLWQQLLIISLVIFGIKA